MKLKNCACSIVFVVFVLTLCLLFIFLPKESYSENEKRVLAEFPSFSFEAMLDGSFNEGVEEYINDHFPMRDVFVGIYSYYNRLMGRGNVSGIYLLGDGSMVAAPSEIDPDKCDRNIGRLESFAEKTGLPATLMIIPSAGYANRDLLGFTHKEYADDAIFASAAADLESVKLIDLRELFTSEEASGKDVYYRTDHHLTSYGSYLSYLEFCNENSITPTQGFADIEKLEGFYGTSYSKSGLWLSKPDTLEIWHSPNNYRFTVTVDDIDQKHEYDSLYFYSHAENMDKYPVFLDGNHAVVTVKNEDVSNGRVLLVVKDSYAHCMSTFLADQYETICLVDMRYYRASVSELAEAIGATELLYVFGAENLASLSELALLR